MTNCLQCNKKEIVVYRLVKDDITNPCKTTSICINPTCSMFINLKKVGSWTEYNNPVKILKSYQYKKAKYS